MADPSDAVHLTGRCYCGQITIAARARPSVVTYCHCADCRRVTGAPVAAFAEFDAADVTLSPHDGQAVSVTPGVTRTFCGRCGSPITGRYDYLPGKVYLSVGLFDQADELPPQLHAHFGEKLTWLDIQDDLERPVASARAKLNR